MFARHPLTGKPIRILNCEGTIWKDAATLVWVDGSTDMAKPWSRYTVGTSTVEAWVSAEAAGVKPEVAVLLGDPVAAKAWLQAGTWSRAALVAAPQAVLESIGIDALAAMKVQNMVCLEEIHTLYPYLGEPWKGTEDDARVLLAGLLRIARTGPATSDRRVGSLQVLAAVPAPAPLIWLTQYYRPEKASRRKEIDLCLQKNVASPLVDQVVLLNETADVELPVANPKIRTAVIGRRLNFAEVIRWILLEAPTGSLVAVANSDIYLDDSWRALWATDMTDKFLSLLRWDDSADPTEPPKLFGPRADSQDTWVVAADSVKARVNAWNWAALDIPFGKGGCDNAINVEMLKQKFLVVNPALTLITHHVHNSGYRTYNPHDIVDRPMYMHVQPAGIHDLKPERTMPAVATRVEETPYDLTIRGAATAGQTRTFHTMSAKAHKDVLQEGTYTPPVAIPIYQATDVFQNGKGLAATYDSILIGQTRAAADAWSTVEMSKVMPSTESAFALVAPCPDAVVKSPQSYILRYLGKVLAMRSAAGKQGDFLTVNKRPFMDALQLFSWPTATVPVLDRDTASTTFCRRALIWHPQDGAAAWPTRAEVNSLRGALRHSWEPKPLPKQRIVFMMDDTWIQQRVVDWVEREFPDAAVECLTAATPFSECVEALLGASAYIYKGGAAADVWANLWILPKGAQVIELQFEMSPNLESVHLARICGLDHYMIVKARDQPSVTEQVDVCDKIMAALGGSMTPPGSPKASRPTKPLLLMPAASGFFSHAGDSFREMARIWADRGYVSLEKRADLCNIWLNSVGDVLLYDRPTMEWLNQSPLAEKKWRTALFGNPDPRGAAGARSWFFWPRRPAIVERLVAERVPYRSFNSRKGLVFHGKTENAVQASRRATDWSTVCDTWTMKRGTEPYALGPEEYLRSLADHRFGLCLAGYGNKCHREIECMAMGTVPICAPEVDMSNYAEPPVEGVHYLRAATPAEAAALVAKAKQEDWDIMSASCMAWWKRNASAEGSWALTKALAEN